ncbi:MAG: glycosyltransferase [Pedobacter sp.]|nr:MAG: glycosyltransferase [Pedobacter sp.]
MHMNVKVLMATYNGESYIEEQLNSILAQEEVKVEINLRDDCSNDNTVACVLKKFPFIKIQQNEKSSGSAGKNFMMMITNLVIDQDVDFIALSDQDDIWLPRKLISAVNLLKENNSDLYCSNLTKWNESENTYHNLKKDYPQEEYDYLFEGGSAGCTYVFTKDFAIELKAVAAQIDHSDWKGFSHDWFIYFFARNKLYKVFIDGISHIYYRIHDNNVHGHLNTLTFKSIKEKFKQVFNGYHAYHAKNYIKFLDVNTESYKIYKAFLSNYWSRNFIILKYNTKLMRDKKKLIVFAILNLLTFKSRV